jgi:hypothetical protein
MYEHVKQKLLAVDYSVNLQKFSWFLESLNVQFYFLLKIVWHGPHICQSGSRWGLECFRRRAAAFIGAGEAFPLHEQNRTEQNRDASRVYETSAESWGLSSAFSSNSGSHRVTVSSHRPEDESCSSQAANAPPMQTSNICRSFHPCKLKESKDIFPS